MERLKSVLADKIIEVSSESGDYGKSNLDKLNRFRDFSFACESLMKKYPQIEDELIRMIESNDFDTRVASSRVNNIITIAENGGTYTPHLTPSQKEEALAEVTETSFDEDLLSVVGAVSEEKNVSEKEEEPIVVATEVITPTPPPYTSSENVSFDYSGENKVKTILTRIIMVLGVVLGIVLVYFAIKFVFHNWQTILIVLGVIAAIGGLIWFVANKKGDAE